MLQIYNSLPDCIRQFTAAFFPKQLKHFTIHTSSQDLSTSIIYRVFISQVHTYGQVDFQVSQLSYLKPKNIRTSDRSTPPCGSPSVCRPFTVRLPTRYCEYWSTMHLVRSLKRSMVALFHHWFMFPYLSYSRPVDFVRLKASQGKEGAQFGSFSSSFGGVHCSGKVKLSSDAALAEQDEAWSRFFSFWFNLVLRRVRTIKNYFRHLCLFCPILSVCAQNRTEFPSHPDHRRRAWARDPWQHPLRRSWVSADTEDRRRAPAECRRERRSCCGRPSSRRSPMGASCPTCREKTIRGALVTRSRQGQQGIARQNRGEQATIDTTGQRPGRSGMAAIITEVKSRLESRASELSRDQQYKLSIRLLWVIHIISLTPIKTCSHWSVWTILTVRPMSLLRPQYDLGHQLSYFRRVLCSTESPLLQKLSAGAGNRQLLPLGLYGRGNSKELFLGILAGIRANNTGLEAVPGRNSARKPGIEKAVRQFP